MKTKSISQRKFLLALKSAIEQGYGEEIVDSQIGVTLAGKICLATIATLGKIAEDPENPELKSTFGSLYDDLMYAGLRFTDLKVCSVGLTPSKNVPYIKGSGGFNEYFFIYLGEDEKLHGYIPKQDVNEAKWIYDFEQDLEVSEETKESKNDVVIIPNQGKASHVDLLGKSGDLDTFNKLMLSKFKRWIKDFNKAMSLPDALHLDLSDKDFVKKLDKNRLAFIVGSLLMNLHKENLGKFNAAVQNDLSKSLDLPEIEDFEVSVAVLGCGVPFLSCKLRTLESPFVYVFIYHDGTDFRAYVPKEGNWINTKNKQIFFRQQINAREDAEWLDEQGIKVDIEWDDLSDQVHKKIEEVLLKSSSQIEAGDYVPVSDWSKCVAEFESMFPKSSTTTETAEVQVQETSSEKKSDVTALRFQELIEMRDMLKNHYCIESNSLISALEGEIKNREGVLKQFDLSTFTGKSYSLTVQSVKYMIKIHTMNTYDAGVFDLVIVRGSSVTVLKNNIRNNGMFHPCLSPDGKLIEEEENLAFTEEKDNQEIDKYLALFP